LRALQAEYERRHGRLPPGIDVAVEKRLPMGGGLGGGSSDAATALMAANHLWQTGLTDAELIALGLPLGADIPFFLFGETAFAEGVGEALQAVPGPDCWYVVIEPGVSVPTVAIFTAPDLTRNTKAITISDFSRRHVESKDLIGFGKNDLQDVAARLFPPVAEAIEWLGGYGAARMTGSGSCVFCAFSTEQEAEQVLKQVPTRWRAWKAKALQRHPMKIALANQ
jgi:4-diphosphocytidyl-2-C-methyl-D-erythritol kinase